MESSIFCSRPACWAPGIENPGDWPNWVDGGVQIEKSTGSPSLEFTSPLFRRRLSQLSRMTVRVVHDALVLTDCGDIQQSFVSLRGEITRQLSMEKALISEETVLPAAFSLSVFNAPIALAAIACGLKSGYSAIFPANESFHDGLVTALSPVLSGSADSILFVYGDELVPAEYGGLHSPDDEPLAFACVVSAKATNCCKIPCGLRPEETATPVQFLRKLLKEA